MSEKRRHVVGSGSTSPGGPVAPPASGAETTTTAGSPNGADQIAASPPGEIRDGMGAASHATVTTPGPNTKGNGSAPLQRKLQDTYKRHGIEVLLEAIRTGLNVTDACTKAGISRMEFYRRGRINPKFGRDVELARIECKERCLLLIQAAAIKEWTAAGWFLERQYPEEFARRTFAQVDQTSHTAPEEKRDAHDLRLALGLPQDAPQSDVDAAMAEVKRRAVQRKLAAAGPNVISLEQSGGFTPPTSEAVEQGAGLMPTRTEERAAVN